jgi:hypothetical protein
MKRMPAMLSLGLLVTSVAACDADLDVPSEAIDEPVAPASSAIALQGALDRTFNGTGLRENADSVAMYTAAVTEATSGMTVVLGNRHFFDVDDEEFVDVATLTRYEPGGAPDPSWILNEGSPTAHGYFNRQGTTGNDVLRAPERDANGVLLEKYYALVDLKQQDVWQSVVVKLLGNGDLDTSFQAGGIWEPPLLGYHDLRLTRLARDATGRIVIAGTGTKPVRRPDGTIFDEGYVILARFDPRTNKFDTTWGQDGWAIQEIGNLTGLGGMAIGQGRNDVVVSVSGPDQVIHFDASGRWDSAGSSTIGLIQDLAVAADGRVFAIGDEGVIGAFKPNLQLMTSFGTNGRLDVKSYPDGPGTDPHELASSIVYSPALDRLFVSGSLTQDHQSTYHASVVAVRPDGTFDRRWAAGSSKMITDFPSSTFESGQALALTSDNKLLMGVSLELPPSPAQPAGGRITGVARFLLDTLRP